jgi:hypothetical protein
MAKSKKTEALEPEPIAPIETAPVAAAETTAKPKRTKQPATDPTPETDGWVDVPPQTTHGASVEPDPEPMRRDPETAPTAKPPKRKASAKTLAVIFAGYLQALDERGGSTGTIASYRMELEMAGEALGVDTPVADLTPERVLAYFTSDPVTRKRNGKAKSPLSIDKTRRVLRQALTWAGHADLVPSLEGAS